MCAFPQPHRGAKICAQSHLVGLTTGFESFCKDQTECLTKPADGKPFLYLGDAQSVGFLRVLHDEQRGNWHGGELLHEDDYSILFDSSGACELMAGRSLSALCYASRTSRPPGNPESSVSPNIIAPRPKISFFMRVTTTHVTTYFGNPSTSKSALLGVALGSVSFFCFASSMEDRMIAIVGFRDALLAAYADSLLCAFITSPLRFCKAMLQQHIATAIVIDSVASASAVCDVFVPAAFLTPDIDVEPAFALDSEFRLDKIPGTFFAGDPSVKMLSSPIALNVVPPPWLGTQACFSPFFSFNVCDFDLFSDPCLSILFQNCQLHCHFVLSADNNTEAFIAPLHSCGMCLLIEQCLCNGILMLLRAGRFQKLRDFAYCRLSDFAYCRLLMQDCCDCVQVWTVRIEHCHVFISW